MIRFIVVAISLPSPRNALACTDENRKGENNGGIEGGLTVQPTPPALVELSIRLRQLRMEQWPGVKLSQSVLGAALGGERALSAPTIASWENRGNPKLPPRERLVAYAQFFATRRSADGPEPRLIPVDSLTPEERTAFELLRDELLQLHASVRGEPAEPITARRSWHFNDTGPATIVCAQLPEKETAPLANRRDPNYTELLSFADLDAMVELHGHVRAENPSMDVFYKAAPRAEPDDLSGHVILVGGIVWNEVTRRLLDLISLPVKQTEVDSVKTGEVFTATVSGKETEYLPSWSGTDSTDLIEDIGLLIRTRNPLNSSRTLSMCNGVHSRGVLGAVRSLTDARLREANEMYIARNFPDAAAFCILMRVQVIKGRSMTPDFSSPGTVLRQWRSAADDPTQWTGA